ncbi:MAG: methylmalonyl-CoA mutase family protein [Nitrospirae bacterium]|nr:methylmalonyl-CoA mutase family protein [Nitrospirota bacterium]
MAPEKSGSRIRWEREVYAKAKGKVAERKPVFQTTSGIPIEPVYDDSNVDGTGWANQMGYPGEPPFTRGIQPTMYRSRFWTMRQYAGFGNAAETNKRYHYLLTQGQTGLSVAFDLPTQMGLDPDHPRAAGEVGRVGVSIASLEDMEELFNGIPLDKISTSMTINATASILLALYIAAARKRGIDPKVLRGTVQNDILKEYVARGTYIYPPRPSLRVVADIIEYCSKHVPQWNAISISGYHIREAGATAVQEVAFTFAHAVQYVQTVLDRKLPVDDFAAQLSFFFDVHNNLVEEVAKFRAARTMWARMMKDRFGAQDPKSWTLRFHAQTAGCSLTAQQPMTNVVRVTIQALAAVLGGAQSLHTNAYDEALALPTEESVMLALRTQQVIAHESGVADIIDPLGGSWAVESFTRQIEERAGDLLDRIQEMGGALTAIEKGYIQNQILQSATEYQRLLETKEEIVVGVNAYSSPHAFDKAILKVDPRLEEAQRKRLQRLRKNRDASKAQAALTRLEAAARGMDNLMPPILEAVEAYATVGEISDTLRKVFGEHREIKIV